MKMVRIVPIVLTIFIFLAIPLGAVVAVVAVT